MEIFFIGRMYYVKGMRLFFTYICINTQKLTVFRPFCAKINVLVLVKPCLT